MNDTERRIDIVALAQAIGRLEAKYDSVSQLMLRIEAALATMPALTTDVVRLKEDVRELRDSESEFKALKNRGAGIAIGLAAAGGLIGAGFSNFVKSLTS